VEVDFASPYVLKLADVAHRTEHNAVRIGVPRDRLGVASDELRAIAYNAGLPPAIAVQPLIASTIELFVGVKRVPDLGCVVALGLGGVAIELSRRIVTRVAPLRVEDAEDMIEDIELDVIFAGFRGQAPLDRAQLVDILVGIGAFAAASEAWLESIDINPLLGGVDGRFVAVDALICVASPRAD
jgi:acetate---CoA ligase (ADP-forming)